MRVQGGTVSWAGLLEAVDNGDSIPTDVQSCVIDQEIAGAVTASNATDSSVATLDQRSARAVAWLSAAPLRAALALVALVLALDLAGLVLLPPLDRTEVIYAQTAKQMLESDGPGTWTAPAFQSEPKFEKPLAVLWLQASSAKVTGQVDQIRGYRIPSILGTILTVLLTYWGVRRLLDARVAFVGAALLATMLVITVQTTLAMPEGLMLAATCAVMFAMGRAYLAREVGDAVASANALVFWTALGVGVLFNVITVPLIAMLTALALIAWDRGKSGWLKQLWSPHGFVLFIFLVALWPFVLWLAGTLGSAVAQWRDEGPHLLLGPQEMKWRVVPGLFVAFLFLGMFPVWLFLGPAIVTAWRERTRPAIRFLIAWVLPYLLFLELFTKKTPLYMVQAMLPPLAVLLAMWVMRETDRGEGVVTTVGSAESMSYDRRSYRFGAFGWFILVVGLVIALWVLPLLLKIWTLPLALLLGFATIAFAAIATKAMLSGKRMAAALSLIVMAVAFNNLAIPVTFAGLGPVWVSSEIRAAVEPLKACGAADVADVIVAGHTEPSAVFELGTATKRAASGKEAAQAFKSKPGIAVISASQKQPFDADVGRKSLMCVAGYDFIKSCSHRFEIIAAISSTEAAMCLKGVERFRCENVPETPITGKMCK